MSKGMKVTLTLFLILFSVNSYAETEPCLTPASCRLLEVHKNQARLSRQKVKELKERVRFWEQKVIESNRYVGEYKQKAKKAKTQAESSDWEQAIRMAEQQVRDNTDRVRETQLLLTEWEQLARNDEQRVTETEQ